MSDYHIGPFHYGDEARAKADAMNRANEAARSTWAGTYAAEYHDDRQACDKCGAPANDCHGWYAVARNEQGEAWTGAPWGCWC